MSVFETFSKISERYSDQIALQGFSGEKITYEELSCLADTICINLIQKGITPGDCLALYCRNSISYVAAILAVCKLGCLYVPLQKGFSRAALDNAVERNKPAVILIDRDGSHAFSNWKSIDLQSLCMENGHSPGCCPVVETGSRPFRRMWSSGSTGLSKLIEWSQARFVRERLRWIEHVKMTSDDRYFCIHPLDVAHATDLHVFSALFTGACCLINDIECGSGDVWRFAESTCPTVLSALPEHYRQWIRYAQKQGSPAPSSVRLAMCGGTFIESNLSSRVREQLGFDLSQIYGSTEFGLALISNPGSDELLPVRGVSAALAGDTGSIASELVLVSDCTCDGYAGDPEATRDLFRDNQFWSGDLAVQHRNGAFRIVGRVKEAIEIDGRIITTSMIDQIAQESIHPLNCASVVKPGDAHSAPLIAVFVDAPASHQKDVDALLASAIRENGLLGDLRPTIRVLPDFPYTDVGKPDKHSLRCEDLN